MLRFTESLSHTAPSSLTSRPERNRKPDLYLHLHHHSRSQQARTLLDSSIAGTTQSNPYFGMAVCPRDTAVFTVVTLIHGMPPIVVDYNASLQ
jgi:hypothetical protein